MSEADEWTAEVTRYLESSGIDVVEAATVVIIVCDGRRCGEETKKSLRADPGARIIVAAVGDERGAVRRATDAGAAGFVDIDDARTSLPPTVHAVLAGQMAIPLRRRGQLDGQTLTTREKQVLALIVMGLRNGEIAGKLFLAESTVKSHLSSAFGKLGVRSRNEASAMILDPASGVGPGILGIPAEIRTPTR